MSPSGHDAFDDEVISELRALAESAARVGGMLARDSFGKRQEVRLKDDRSEVTDVDIATEQAVIEHIRNHRPDDVFIGEESIGRSRDDAPTPKPQSLYWVIDPIDGTRNYIRDLPIFTCAVAAMHAGQPVSSAIHDPINDTLYSAALGAGVHVNGRPASWMDEAQNHASKPGAKLLIGIPSALRPGIRHLVLHAVEHHVIRNLGSAALHLAMAALGQLDLVLLGNTKLWDIAAGLLMVREAGGHVTSATGGPVFPLDLARYRGEEIAAVAGRREAHARLMREAKRR